MDDNIDPSISSVGLLERHEKFDDIVVKDEANSIHGGLDTTANAEPDSDLFGLNYVDDLHKSNNIHSNNGANAATTDANNIHEDATAAINIMNLTNFDFEHEAAENPFVEYSDDDKQTGGAVKLVQYNPGEKLKRLGRPRKHITSKLTPPENHSSSNYNESIVSKFRLDSQPVEGPGSRGGRQGVKPTPRGRVATNGARKRKQQSSLSFTSEKDDDSKAEVGSNSKKQIILKLTLQSPRREPKRKKQAVKQDPKIKKSSGVSRTTILRNKNKITRQLPGPLVGVYYDLYDDNLMTRAKIDEVIENENLEIGNAEDYKYRIAAGYKVKPAPYANDIVYIIAFLNKFREVIGIDGIGPQSLEKGLSLPPDVLTDDYDPSYISDQMIRLFKRILTLVLNRKKEVVSHASAIMELKPMSQYLGMPKEWRTDELNNIDDEVGSPVDPNSPDILLTGRTYYKYLTTVTYNPFKLNEFESKGLAGMPNPEDRLVLFRTLMQWCLTSSDAIKNHVNQTVQAQDLPGDRDTIYGARSILKGSKATEDAKKEAESKLAKRKSEEDAKYIDPTTNPLEHTLKIRLMEELVSDCGYKVGRFYLCRMANETNGGLTSLKKMESTWRDSPRISTRPPSDFKLYVQDIHGMLENALSQHGVEFDDNSAEIMNDYEEEDDHWYEVASNSAGLVEFAGYLGKILGHTKTQPQIKTISVTSKIYLPLVNLRKYILALLPLITKQESVDQVEDRLGRRKPIDYSHKVEEFIDDTEEVQYPPEVAGDDDYEDEEVIVPADDDDDYEYED